MEKEVGNSLHLQHWLSRGEGMTKMAVTFLLSLSPIVTDDLKTLRGQAECPLPLFPFKAVTITSLHILRSVTLAQNSDVSGCTKWGED